MYYGLGACHFYNLTPYDVRLIQSVPFNYLLVMATSGGPFNGADSAVLLPDLHCDLEFFHLLFPFDYMTKIRFFSDMGLGMAHPGQPLMGLTSASPFGSRS